MPDLSLVAPPNTTGPDSIAACRAPDARYALIDGLTFIALRC